METRKFIATRATEEELKIIDAAAERDNRTRSGFLIVAALEKAKKEVNVDDIQQQEHDKSDDTADGVTCGEQGEGDSEPKGCC